MEYRSGFFSSCWAQSFHESPLFVVQLAQHLQKKIMLFQKLSMTFASAMIKSSGQRGWDLTSSTSGLEQLAYREAKIDMLDPLNENYDEVVKKLYDRGVALYLIDYE